MEATLRTAEEGKAATIAFTHCPFRELAEQYLAQPTMTLLEVAYLLGFADPSNFFRAFRRWFGTTPGEYRARAVATPVSDARTPEYTARTP